MLLQQPIFPGNDYIHQLKLIVKMLGRPSTEDLWFISNKNAMSFMLQLPDYAAQDFKLKFPDARASALELLALMLQFNPQKRIRAREALSHKYVEEYELYLSLVIYTQVSGA